MCGSERFSGSRAVRQGPGDQESEARIFQGGTIPDQAGRTGALGWQGAGQLVRTAKGLWMSWLTVEGLAWPSLDWTGDRRGDGGFVRCPSENRC